MSTQRPYFVVDAFAYEPFTGNPAAVVTDAEGLDDTTMARIAAEFNLSETTFITPVLQCLPPDRSVQDVSLGRHAERSEASPARHGFEELEILRCAQNDARNVLEVPRPNAQASVRFRWFTPTVEVAMCGHATIAGLHALVEAGGVAEPGEAQATVVSIHARSGILTGFIEQMPGLPGRRMIWLELVPPTLSAIHSPLNELAGALRMPTEVFDEELPPAQTQDRDLIVFVRDVMALNALTPDFHKVAGFLEERGLRGLSVATVKTISPAYNVQSRFFAPTAGIDEDPVTGSVHGPLAAYLVQRGRASIHDGVAALTCGQAKPGGRGGLLHALVMQQADGLPGVRIGGRAITTMRGELLV